MPPKILMSGYFGLDNLGDEAIFEAMVHNFRQHCPDVDVTALVADPQRAQRLGIRWAPRKHLPSLMRELRRCDLLVSGGGGLIQDSTGVGSVAYYLGLIRLAAWLGKPTFLYAQGFGPVKTDWGQRLCRWMSPAISLATFRDQESLNDFRQLCISRPTPPCCFPPALPKNWPNYCSAKG